MISVGVGGWFIILSGVFWETTFLGVGLYMFFFFFSFETQCYYVVLYLLKMRFRSVVLYRYKLLFFSPSTLSL